jgi:hypothetical protein
VPERYGTWQSIYGLFRAWQLTGTWAAILTGRRAMAAEAGLIECVVLVDSTINRAHQHAAGARRHPEDQAELSLGEPGRSRAGPRWRRLPPEGPCHRLQQCQREGRAPGTDVVSGP